MKGYTEHKVKQTSVWSTNLIDNGIFSKDEIKKSLEDIFILKEFLDPGVTSHGIYDSPGIQYTLSYSFSDVVDRMLKHCKKETTNTYLHRRTNKSFKASIFTNWIYMAFANEPRRFWHHHENLWVDTPEPKTGKLRRVPFRGDLTYVLYLSLPENMEEKGGLIHFTNKAADKSLMEDINLKEYTYKPKIGDLIIFPAGLNHMPEQSSDPTTRVIIGGNAHFRKNPTLI